MILNRIKTARSTIIEFLSIMPLPIYFKVNVKLDQDLSKDLFIINVDRSTKEKCVTKLIILTNRYRFFFCFHAWNFLEDFNGSNSFNYYFRME